MICLSHVYFAGFNGYAVITNRENGAQNTDIRAAFRIETVCVRTMIRRFNANVQERKMQETLRDRAFSEYLEEQKQEEAKENDQRTSFTYGQKQKEEE